MEIAAQALVLKPVETSLDGYEAGAEHERAGSVEEAGVREVAGWRSCVDEKSRAPVSAQSGQPRVALPSLDRLRLDPDLDFIVQGDGVIELTEAGFRRMVQAHSAGLDAVIAVDRRELLRLPAPKLGQAPCARQAIEPRCAELIEAHIRRTQPVAELLKAEESREMALNMINKERERHEIESMLPWHAAGTLDRSDAERVEQALAEDGELARRYELVREELAETIQLNESLGAPSACAMEKLFAAIDAEEVRAPRTPRFSGTSDLATASPQALP